MTTDDELFEPWRHPVSGAFALYRRRAGLLLGLTAVPVAAQLVVELLPLMLLRRYRGAEPPDPNLISLASQMTCYYAPALWILGLAIGLVSTAAMAGTLGNHRVAELPWAVRHLGRRLGDLLTFGILIAVTIGGLYAVLSIPVTAILIAGGDALPAWSGLMSVVLFLVQLIAAIIAYARLGLSFEYILLTRRGAWQSITGSWTLTRGRARRMLAYSALAELPLALGILAPGLAAKVLGPATPAALVPGSMGAIVGRGVVQLFWSPYALALMLLVWLNLRGEHERISPASLAREISQSARQPLEVIADEGRGGTDDEGAARRRPRRTRRRPH